MNFFNENLTFFNFILTKNILQSAKILPTLQVKYLVVATKV